MALKLRPFPPPAGPSHGPWKAADVERFPDDGYQYEIWGGELVRVAPAGGKHGECEANLVAALRTQTHAQGRVYTGDTGFLLREDPDELVSPDVAFVQASRLPPAAERTGYLRVVPDLAVEIRSPNDSDADVEEKLALRGGRCAADLADRSTTGDRRRDPCLAASDVTPQCSRRRRARGWRRRTWFSCEARRDPRVTLNCLCPRDSKPDQVGTG